MKENYTLDPEKFINIMDRLEDWRTVRHIDIKSQVPGLYANLLEEQAELERAILSNDIDGVVDAYCDMVIFLLNAYDIRDWFKNHIKDGKVIELPRMPIKTSVLNGIRYTTHNELKLICVEPVKNINKEVFIFVSHIFSTIYMYGYDPIMCVEEVIKHISSRIGKWDETIKKFVKDTSEEAKAKWYEHDFNKCKIGE